MSKVFPKKYSGKVAFNQHLINAKKEYENGNFIEAFVILYSLIEFELNVIWSMYVILQRTIWPLSHKIHRATEKEYAVLVEILFEVGLFDEKSRDYFIGFKKGRNNVVHELMKWVNQKNKKVIHRKTIDSQFCQGIKSYELVLKLHGEIANKLSKHLEKLAKNLQ